MKLLYILITFLFSFGAFSKEAPIHKSWHTFQNNYGYEFKYPECWIVSNGSPDEEGELNTVSIIGLREKESCLRAAGDKDISHGIGFLFLKKIKSDDIKKSVLSQMEISKIQLKNKDWLVFKKIDIEGGGGAVMYVDYQSQLPKTIRWVMKLYCPSSEFLIAGASTTNPPKELLQKFEKGDLAVPEPEKKVFESIRCIKPKMK